MQEHISLPLAKRIAEKYKILGVEAPKAERVWIKRIFGDPITIETWHLPITIETWHLTDPDAEGSYCPIAPAYTAAELFDALPVGTEVIKLLDSFCVNIVQQTKWEKNFRNTDSCINKELAEALGLMLERVLEERRREKEK
jgi:hypothetical protein